MRDQKIVIMGLGYVGLTLAVTLAKKGFKVYGVEKKKEIVESLKIGKAHFSEKKLEALLKQQQKLGTLEITQNLPNEKIGTYIICVGTPLKKDQNAPNIDYIKDVTIDVANHMKPGSLIVLRSTVPVWISRTFVIPLLEKYSRLKAGKEFLFVVIDSKRFSIKGLLNAFKAGFVIVDPDAIKRIDQIEAEK